MQLTRSGSAEDGRHSPSMPLDHIHHAAYRCRDARQTRWFWEEVLGFELTMALAFETDPATGLPYEYMHLFFRMGDGNLVAFFDAPDDAGEEMFAPAGGYDLHVAFECESEAELSAWQERLGVMGVPCGDPIDHGFIRSLYMYDPNGLQVEITAKTSEYASTVASERAQVEEMMEAWTKKTRAKKEKAFGAERIDMRGELCRENIMKIIEQMMNVGRTG